MAPIGPLEDFCHECGRPITAMAAMDPFKQVFAQGHIYREAASRPRSLFVVLGMWLIFGPAVLGMSLVLQPSNLSRTLFGTGSSVQGYLELVLSLGLVVLYAVLLYRVTANYLRSKDAEPGHCLECGYNLTGLSEPRCPECGVPFDPEEAYSSQNEDMTCEPEEPLEPGDPDEDTVAAAPAQSSDESPGGFRGSWVVGISILVALACGIVAYKNPEMPGEPLALIAVGSLLFSGFFFRLTGRRPSDPALNLPENSEHRSDDPRNLPDPSSPNDPQAYDPKDELSEPDDERFRA